MNIDNYETYWLPVDRYGSNESKYIIFRYYKLLLEKNYSYTIVKIGQKRVIFGYFYYIFIYFP